MKKKYMKPEQRVVCIGHQQIICTSGQRSVENVSSDATGITYGGGSSGASRVRERSAWKEEW